MPVNLLAICKHDNHLILKRVRVSADVQNQLEGIFIQQQQDFFDDVDEEVLFDGGWEPDPNELIYSPITPEAEAILQAAQLNIVALPEVNPNNFDEDNIKALGVRLDGPNGPRLLLQEFSSRQVLDRKFSLTLNGETFTRLTQPTFTMGVSLAGVVEAGRIKFKKYSRIRIIFDLSNMYQEATEAEIETFCGHDSLEVGDVAAFKTISDQKMRKLIHAIIARGTLDEFTPQQIVDAGDAEGFAVQLDGGRVSIPDRKADAKALLYFLDNGLYRGRFGGQIFITNSKRVHVPAA